MKKFLVVLLSLGLVMAFSMSAFAATIDFGGHVRTRGWFWSNPSLLDTNTTANASSVAFVEQRLRAAGVWKLLDGVQINSRFDVTEGFWAAPRTDYVVTGAAAAPGSTVEQQNIQWDVLNMAFQTKLGNFLVGSTNAPLAWGTKYWESGEGIRYVVRYEVPVGPVAVRATWEKKAETTLWGSQNRLYTDADSDIYALGGKYKGKNFETGLQWQFLVNNSAKPGVASATAGYSTQLHAFQPYVMATFGKLYVEAEGLYVTGDSKKYDDPAGTNVNVSAKGYGAFVNAKYTMGAGYLAFMFNYTSGDDPNTTDTKEGNFAADFDGASSTGGSTSPRPLILLQNTTFNGFFGNQVGGVNSSSSAYKGRYNTGSLGANTDNIWQYSIYGAYTFTPKWDTFFTYVMNRADKKPVYATAVAGQPAEFLSDDIGNELDLVLNYRITKQLTYSVQGAYFWVGDYWKGTNAAAKVDNNYILMHALLLEF